MSKQYGLSFPKISMGHKIGQVSANKPSIFEDDSDTEDQIKVPTGVSKGLKKQDTISREKAVAQDPTVYQYDEVYDEIEKKRSESKLAKKDMDKKPKYISRLLVAADKRKRENERRIERQVQKEREEEGNKFEDKESFITPSYKKKLEEMKELEEQEKREEYLESIGDVKKQGNLDGFYRHLYDQKVNYEENEGKEEKPSESEKETKVEQKEEDDEGLRTPPLKRDVEKDKSGDNGLESKQQARKRKYRSRKDSEEDSNSEKELEVKKEHLPSNIDADSDFSINSSDSEDEKQPTEDKNKEEIIEKPEIPKEAEKPDKKEDKPEEKIIEVKKEVKAEPKKPKVDIWKKRTVGEKFDEAVKRYFERKALREMGQ